MELIEFMEPSFSLEIEPAGTSFLVRQGVQTGEQLDFIQQNLENQCVSILFALFICQWTRLWTVL